MGINENKSVHIDFAYRKNVQIPVAINNTNILYSNSEIPGNESGHPITTEGTYKKEKEGARPQI
jgi:hypothetical protein